MLLFEWPVLSEMISEVEPYAHERCGFIVGREKDENKIITGIIPVTNHAVSGDAHGAYKILPSAYQQAERVTEINGLKLLGVYHSHPNCRAIPSRYDLQMAQPNFIYVIISVYHKKMKEVRSWQLNDRQMFDEIMIDFLPSSKYTIHQPEELLEFQ